MGNQARKIALRSFLIEHRARLRPEDVGLPRYGRRRVEGLRREEVAMLVGVSVAWYTQFETGAIRVSPRMLDRVANALRLDNEEKLYLFSLAIDEMPAVIRHTMTISDGTENAVLMHFTKRARAASSPQELEELTVDFLYDRYRPVEIAQVIHADLDRREFWTTTQRTAPDVEAFPTKPQPFSLVHDAEPVLVRCEIFPENNLSRARHALMRDRQQKFGTGRYISVGVHAGTSVAALNVTQQSKEPYSDREKYRFGLIAEIFALTVTSRY
jgi:transcriptional regulator with XRE-family HTH domain